MPYFGVLLAKIKAKVKTLLKLGCHFLDVKIIKLYLKKIRRELINSSHIQAANCDFISPSVYQDSTYKGKLTIPVW